MLDIPRHTLEIKITTTNKRFSINCNNCFDLKIFVKFEVTASFEDFG